MQSFEQENDSGAFNRPKAHKSMLRLASLRPHLPNPTRFHHPNSHPSNFHAPRHRTQETSPVFAKDLRPLNHRLPELQIGDFLQQRRAWAAVEQANCVSKTTHILDSLISNCLPTQKS